MAKFTWQDGTLVSKAKVEINGIIYEVDPEEYSGATPLSAGNLNAMQDGIYDDVGILSNLETSNKTNLVSAINSTLPIVLYNNSQGSNTDITLNDAVENYEYIEIFYKNNDGFYSSRKFCQPSGKKLVLDSYYVSSADIVFKYNCITITGTTLTRNAFAEVSRANISSVDSGAKTYITRIIGYN